MTGNVGSLPLILSLPRIANLSGKRRSASCVVRRWWRLGFKRAVGPGERRGAEKVWRLSQKRRPLDVFSPHRSPSTSTVHPILTFRIPAWSPEFAIHRRSYIPFLSRLRPKPWSAKYGRLQSTARCNGASAVLDTHTSTAPQPCYWSDDSLCLVVQRLHLSIAHPTMVRSASALLSLHKVEVPFPH